MRISVFSFAIMSVLTVASQSAFAITVTLAGGCKTGGTCYCTKPGKPKGLVTKMFTSECYLVETNGDRLQNKYEQSQRPEAAIALCLNRCLGKEDASPSELDKYKSFIKEKPAKKKK